MHEQCYIMWLSYEHTNHEHVKGIMWSNLNKHAKQTYKQSKYIKKFTNYLLEWLIKIKGISFRNWR